MILKSLAFFVCLLTASFTAFPQYTLNGSASQNDCHCYTLTNDGYNQTGSIWNNNKISLSQSFDFSFEIFVGCADIDGADGIAFVLQPISTSVGSTGNGLGYAGVSPAVGITIDTWQNGSPDTDGPDGDPAYDHIAIQLNGDLLHKDSAAPYPVNNIAGPVTAVDNSANIEDCQWHTLRISWDPGTKIISAYIDGVLRVSAVKDLVKDVFNNDPMVFWGFTGSTGGAKNLQQVCTALKPLFRLLPDQKRCVGEKIYFFDSTISFAPIQKRYWNFGDGTPVDSVSKNPVHAYRSAGEYTVTQTVLGVDGCTEVNTQKTIIGSKPVASFTYNNACVTDSAVLLTSTASATVGTVNAWFWDLGNGNTSLNDTWSEVYQTPGAKTIRLAVRSMEGCLSDTVTNTVQVYDKPLADFSFTDNQCAHTPVSFTGTSTVAGGSTASWNWNLDSVNSRTAAVQNPTAAYDVPGSYSITLFTRSDKGCVSPGITKLLTIVESPVAAFNQEPICLNQPAIFTNSSSAAAPNTITGWWWNLGNGVTLTTKDASTIYKATGEFTIALAVKTENGCWSDTLRKTVSIEPSPKTYFVYTSPLCEGSPVGFADSTIVASGAIRSWHWTFDNATTSADQSPGIIFTSGVHHAKLWVTSTTGCVGDTVVKTLSINPRPRVDFTIADVCANTRVAFTGIDKGATEIGIWQWSFGDGTVSVDKDTAHVYTAGGTYPVRLLATSTAGCVSDSIQQTITVFSTRAFAGNDTIAATNQPLQLHASGGVNYEWTPARGLSNPAISDPVAILGTDQMYILRAFTPAGCQSFDTILVRVFDGPEIYVPSAFTPNGDGLNDLLKALPVGVSLFKSFTVYNRMGQIVFTTNLSTLGWNGIFKGKAQNPGIYTWSASAAGTGGYEIRRKGTVMLIR